MKAGQKMASRIELVADLIKVDNELKSAFAAAASIRASERARRLLDTRAFICDELTEAGYQPWPLPGSAA